MSCRLLLLLGALALVACEPTPRTQVMVSVEAESGVLRDAVRVRVSLQGGLTTLTDRVDQQIGGATEPVEFPVRVAIVPEGNDASRRFAVAATAFDAADNPLGTVRALSSFVQGRTLGLRLLLEDCCRPITCDTDFTCRGCECVPAIVDPIMLVELGTDAGQQPADAFMSRDASVFDAFVPEDAMSVDAARTDAGPPPCEGDIPITERWASGGRSGPLPFGALFWSRPELNGGSMTACPALTTASGADRVAYGTLTLCNASGRPRDVVATVSGVADSMRPALEDPYLVVYAGLGIPADPLQCLVQNGDENMSTRDARLTFTIPVDGTVTIVISSTLNDQVGRYEAELRPL